MGSVPASAKGVVQKAPRKNTANKKLKKQKTPLQASKKLRGGLLKASKKKPWQPARKPPPRPQQKANRKGSGLLQYPQIPPASLAGTSRSEPQILVSPLSPAPPCNKRRTHKECRTAQSKKAQAGAPQEHREQAPTKSTPRSKSHYR